MVSIELLNPHWLAGSPVTADLCLHGGARIVVGETELVSGADSNLCVSAAALYLLRSLEHDHRMPSTSEPEPPWGPLVPHCGHAMYPAPNGDVAILGCPHGNDLEVVHEGSNISLRSGSGHSASVPAQEWSVAVHAFAEAVEREYAQGPSKQPHPDDAPGFRAFWAEWERRTGRHARYGA